MRGIDVSVWQRNIDFDKVKAAGIDFVIIRAGYGRVKDQQDAYFEQNYRNAKAAGLKIGAYHYSYAMSVPEAKVEAAVCLEWLKGKTFDLPIYFDIEENRIARLGKKTCTEITKAFCEAIKAKGYKAGVYANLNWFKNYLDYETLKKSYSIWLAQYNITNDLDCDIWQNSCKGSVNGVQGYVDTNYCYADFNANNAATNKNKAPTKKTIKVGSKVKVIKAVQYRTNKPFKVYYDVYDVIELKGKRAVIGIGKEVTAAVNTDNLEAV